MPLSNMKWTYTSSVFTSRLLIFKVFAKDKGDLIHTRRIKCQISDLADIHIPPPFYLILTRGIKGSLGGEFKHENVFQGGFYECVQQEILQKIRAISIIDPLS